jgi:hypothetical protein
MKRRRGRPQGPAKLTKDIHLVWFVRSMQSRGATVAEACAVYRANEGRGCVESLKRRYLRVASAFPDSGRVPGIGTAILCWVPTRRLS